MNNVFERNGKYVLAYYLDKDVEEITHDDVCDNIDVMVDRIAEFLKCDKYSNILCMRFSPNSKFGYSAKSIDESKIQNFKNILKEFKDNEGEDACCICGNHHANVSLDIIGRNYYPNLASRTLYNYSNGFKGVNICPYCVILSVYSVLNTRVNGDLYLYNSNNQDFMYKYTEVKQEEIDMEIGLSSNCNTTIKSKNENGDSMSKIDVLVNLISNNMLFNDFIEIYEYNNSHSQDTIGNLRNSEQLYLYGKQSKLIRKLNNKSLLDEFKKLHLSELLLNDNIKSFLNYIYDWDKECIKCSNELFNFLKGEVLNMDEKTMDIINKVVNGLKCIGNKNKIIHELRVCSNLPNFKDFLMKHLCNKDIEITMEDYNIVTNRFKYKDIKNLIIIELLQNK